MSRPMQAAQASGAPVSGAPAQTPAPGPSALDFATPSVGPHALSFISPMGVVRAEAAGGKRSRTVVEKNGGVPHVLPAPPVPGVAGAPAAGKRRRGKSKGRTPAGSVGAEQRLGENLVHFNDAGQKLAVEGTVEGDAGKHHFAASCGVAMLVGAVQGWPGFTARPGGCARGTHGGVRDDQRCRWGPWARAPQPPLFREGAAGCSHGTVGARAEPWKLRPVRYVGLCPRRASHARACAARRLSSGASRCRSPR